MTGPCAALAYTPRGPQAQDVITMRTLLLHPLCTRALSLCGLLLVLPGAQAEDLPKSPACRTALQALNQAEDALADTAAAASAEATERRRSVAVQLQPLRRRVADACLGGLTTSPPPSQHTLVVPAPPARPATATPRLLTPATPPVVVTAPRPDVPVTVTTCNAVTCLGSDGSTLTRVGPNLVGPRGACTVQGIFVRCP